jgi:hypothetical protein
MMSNHLGFGGGAGWGPARLCWWKDCWFWLVYDFIVYVCNYLVGHGFIYEVVKIAVQDHVVVDPCEGLAFMIHCRVSLCQLGPSSVLRSSVD